jgi:hypothetical protein
LTTLTGADVEEEESTNGVKVSVTAPTMSEETTIGSTALVRSIGVNEDGTSSVEAELSGSRISMIAIPTTLDNATDVLTSIGKRSRTASLNSKNCR